TFSYSKRCVCLPVFLFKLSYCQLQPSVMMEILRRMCGFCSLHFQVAADKRSHRIQAHPEVFGGVGYCLFCRQQLVGLFDFFEHLLLLHSPQLCALVDAAARTKGVEMQEIGSMLWLTRGAFRSSDECVDVKVEDLIAENDRTLRELMMSTELHVLISDSDGMYAYDQMIASSSSASTIGYLDDGEIKSDKDSNNLSSSDDIYIDEVIVQIDKRKRVRQTSSSFSTRRKKRTSALNSTQDDLSSALPIPIYTHYNVDLPQSNGV
ncbi:hypothetical protein PFISCL1PPCAC_1029, partial [Pristionchus fissidentatus]